MAQQIIYNDGDSKVKITLTFPTGKDWTSYTYVHIRLYNKNSGELLQTSGYPTGQGDNDLYVPNTSSGICYMKINDTNIDGKNGICEWWMLSSEADTDYNDNKFNPVHKFTKLLMQ